MEIEYFSREKLTKIFHETSVEKFILEMVTKSWLCCLKESSKFNNSILFPILWSIFERLSPAPLKLEGWQPLGGEVPRELFRGRT